MEFSIVLKSLLLILLFRILPLAQTEPRAADRSVYSTFFKRSLSSNFAANDAKMILINSIEDDQVESPSMVKNKADMDSKLDASSGGKEDPPIFNVIPDSSDKGMKPKPIHDSTSMMQDPGSSSIVSDLMKQPEVLLDVFKLKLARYYYYITFLTIIRIY